MDISLLTSVLNNIFDTISLKIKSTIMNRGENLNQTPN